MTRAEIARKSLRILGVIAAALAAASAAVWWISCTFTINVTPSVPRGIYRYEEGMLRKGDLASVCLPPSWLTEAALERGYLLKGGCPGGYAPVIKRVAAAAGDRVSIGESGISVNGEHLPETVPKEKDSKGRVLPLLIANRRLRNGEFVLASENDPKGFDSRYFGILSGVAARRVVPVWIE